MSENSLETKPLVEELQALQEELKDLVHGVLQAQQPLLNVLKVEFRNELNLSLEHLRHLRRLVREMLARESSPELGKTSALPPGKDNISFVEKMDALVSAALNPSRPGPHR